MPTKLNTEILNADIEGFEAQKSRIDARIAEIRQVLNDGRTEPAATPEPPKRKRKLSAAGRKRIIEATKKRWAAIHAAKQAEKAVVAKKAAVKKAVGMKTAAKKATKVPKGAVATVTAQ